jgi:hypothetical protein
VFYKNEVLKSCLFKLLFICLSASIVFAYSGGSGTAGSPYQIASKVDLLALAAAPADYGKCFILTADINMAGQTFTTAIIAPDTNSISGFQGTAFTGTFDGSGHKITNFTINGGSNSYLALFGQVNIGGSVKNLGLENFSVSGSSTSSYVGGLVGYNNASDGPGSIITNCYSTGSVSGSSYVGGLVGYNNTSGGPPRSLITNCYSTGTVSGNLYAGGLVGRNYSNISTCYSTGTVSGSGIVGGLVGGNSGSSGNITNCCSTGAVSSTGITVGGLVGSNSGNISNSYSTSLVSGSGTVGGLVGDNGSSISSSISSCYSTGSVSSTGSSNNFGGLVGSNGGSISDCYSTSPVSGSLNVGGLVGYHNGGSFRGITNCYATGTVSGSSNVGGLVGSHNFGNIVNSFWDTQTSGQTTSQGGTGKTTAQMKTLSTFTGWDFTSIWHIVQGQTYPFLKKWNYSGGDGTQDAPYEIANIQDLLTLGGTVADSSKYFILTADINMAGYVSAAGIIASFAGTFDGNSHKITHFTINSTGNDYIGLFGQINSGGSVKNLGIENFSINGYFSDAGGLAGYNNGSSISNCYSIGDANSSYDSSSIGGLVGENNGSISNCYSTSAVSEGLLVGGLVGKNNGTISNCYSTGEVSGSDSVGGLVGENIGIITNCYSTTALSGKGWHVGGLVGFNYDGSSISNCYSTALVSGTGHDVGGLVGENGGSISNCYSTGAVSGSSIVRSSSLVGGLVGDNDGSISNCYSTGSVSGGYYVGGLVGENYGGSISTCYSTGDVSSFSSDNYNPAVGGLVGNNYYGSISNCYSAGLVSSFSSYNCYPAVGGLVGANDGSISNCYSIGPVSGTGDYVGGLVGESSDGSISASFWDVNTSGQTTGYGGTGKTTAQMKTLSTFTSAGWDFSYSDGDDAVWFMPINEYPILTWQISPADIYTDGKNNFRDFAVFANYWMRDDCRRYNSYCDWSDLNFDGSVNIDDLVILMSYWLQQGIYE